MNITVNGNRQNIFDGATILDLLTDRGIEPAHVVAEINGTIVQRDAFGARRLNDGDSLEIVRFVGGG